MVTLGEIAFWSLEGGDTVSCPEGNDPLGMPAVSVTHNMCWTVLQKYRMRWPVILPARSPLTVQHRNRADLLLSP